MIVSWMTTNQCNLNCSHCYQDAGEPLDRELDTDEAKVMISSIADAGFRIMIFSGGEPLLRGDILELVTHAATEGLRPVFGTNGTLITDALAVELKAAGAQAMGISLDSLDEASHNRFRGCTDAFVRTMAGIESCKRAGLPFQLHTTVMDWNRHEVLAISDFAAKTGAVAHYIFFLIPVGRGTVVERSALEIREYESTLTAIVEYQQTAPITIKPTCAPQFLRIARRMELPARFERGCLAGLSYCIVSPVGVVRPCAYMTEQAGNVRADSFAAVWRDSALFHRLRAKRYTGSCGICDFREVCGGCRARASYYHGGDFMAEDSYCAYHAGRPV